MENKKILIDCMYTKEILISLIEYFSNKNIIIILRKTQNVDKQILKNIEYILSKDRIILYEFKNKNTIEKIYSRLKEWNLFFRINKKYNSLKKIIFFREGSILFNQLKKNNKIFLYEHGMINYQKTEEMFHGKKITLFNKIILKCFGESISSYGRDKNVEKIYLFNPEKAPFDIKEKVKKLDLRKKWENLKKEDKENIINIFGLENLNKEEYEGKIILLTQPLSEQKLISEEEKLQIYSKIIENYSEKEIVIKVHPREKTNYSKYFKCQILSNKFPIEILELENIRFKKAITLYSTAINSFNYEIEKEILGTEISENLKKSRGVIK